MGVTHADKVRRELDDLAPQLERRRTRPGSRSTLVVGRVDDPAERAADFAADRALRRIDRAGPFTDRPDDSRIRRAAAPDAGAVGPEGGPVSADVEQRIRRSTGRPLGDDVRGPMEAAFGADLGGVRVHTGPAAERLNRDLGARAFTTGQDVFFGAGEYRPRSGGGSRVLAHELAHTIQQRGAGPVQRIQRRTALTTAQVMTALRKTEFLRKRLDTDLHGMSMNDRITETLDLWEQHAAAKTNPDMDLHDAMMLSTALEGVARIIAEGLNDVSVQPLVSAKLFELYRSEVGTKIKRQNADVEGATRTKVLDLTAALIADDPVTRYLHREISLRRAASTINAMATRAQATDATITPLKMYELMEQKFQAKMATYRQAQLHRDDKSERFSARESHGEYSTYFFRKMFGAKALNNPGQQLQWKQKAGEADRLTMTRDTEAKLKALRDEVANPTAAANVVPRDASMTEGQERHLASIDAAEQAIDMTTIKSAFVTFFQHRYHMTKGDADSLYADVGRFLAAAPLTITVRAQDWFGGKKAPDPNFKPSSARVKRTKVSKAFGKWNAKGSVEHLPTWNDAGLTDTEQRGAKYLRFRAWKDELMSGLNELSSSEKAVFGALNINYETTIGSDALAQHGANYYGDLHFVLDRTRVEDRMIYTSTDHGQHRRDPMLALNDFTFGGRGVTWLKDTKNLAVIDNIVNAIGAKMPLYGLPLLFEIQIFGGLNIKTDVTEVTLGPAVTAPTEAAVTAFYAGTGVTIKKAAPAPTNAVQVVGDVDQALMTAIIAGARLPATAKQAVADDVAASTIIGPFQKLLRNTLTVARYLKQSAEADPTSLTPADIATLDAAYDELVKTSQMLRDPRAVQPNDLKLVADRVKEARDAIDAAKRANRPRRANARKPAAGKKPAAGMKPATGTKPTAGKKPATGTKQLVGTGTGSA